MAELTQVWWNKNKAKTLKSTGLGEAIGRYESALAEARKLATSEIDHKTFAQFKAAEQTVLALPAAIDRAMGMCNATLHKDTIAILKEYKSKLVPAAGAKLSDMAGTFEKRYRTLEADIKKSCAELYRLAGDTLDGSRIALQAAERLIAESDGEKMAMIEDLAHGATGRPAAEKRLQEIQAKGAEIARHKAVAAQALTAARATVKTKWIYKAGVLDPAQDNNKRTRDNITGLFDASEMNIDKIEPLIALAHESAKEAARLLKGEADLSKVYLASAQRAAATAKASADRLGGAARENGGRVDALKFDFMNASEKFDKDKDRKAFMVEVKRVVGGAAVIDKQCSGLAQAAAAARAEIAKALKTFPEFVRDDRAHFGQYFETMAQSDVSLEDSEDVAAKGRAELKKLTALLAAAAQG